ncbi:precorrin-6A reductase [Methanobacterium ferruginis]|uniref:precorrin-6A reductase n=1 Tax=Methanobacterium ferruginis TaxID=710191 RepID=UPI00257314BE|nr:precorrin-6A reductase [Methanobacterium ferruginis]BDZ67923.1 precorrin-6A reductase [Methanobacterium ferruginis]
MNILVMAGTSDARKIIKELSSRKNVNIIATATTNHGTELARSSGADGVLEGRFNSEELAEIMNDNQVELLIDATHPFASAATRNAILASETLRVTYARFERPSTEIPNNELIYPVKSFEDAAVTVKGILNQNQNDDSSEEENHSRNKVLHLAGVNTLHYLTSTISPDKIVARVLPMVYSIKKCLELGIPHYNIVAMEGTFSPEFNGVLMKEFQIKVVLTKESGQSGGTMSKIQASLDLNIPVIVVMRPEIAELQGKLVFDDVKVLCDKVLE